MSREKLNKWAELLLDTGKRNNLVNFKDRLGTVEVLFPKYSSLFSRAEHSAVFEVFDPELEEDDEEAEDLKIENASSSVDEDNFRAEYENKYNKKLKRNQMLLYSSDKRPISTLKDISKRASLAVEEAGVNIAYISFGFISWRENGASDYMLSPLLLVPITIENESSVKPYYIKVTDDEIIVNPTFAFKLLQEYNIKLPEFDEEAGIEEYFIKVDEILSPLKWRVIRRCRIGIFSFLKINMYKDLTDNAEVVLKNPNVLALLGEPQGKNEEQSEENRAKSNSLELHNVVDADSSQSEAISMAVSGKSFVLQGPPGTGKSQTITNMIAECLLNGKRVLFVSEKLAALSVVYEKLKKAGLEEFCLELHSHKANKNRVIEELCHTLKLQKSALSLQAEREINARKEVKDHLDGYVRELHKVRPVINKTLFDLYEESSACRYSPDTDTVIKNINKKGDDYIDKAEKALTRYVSYIPTIGYDYKKNVWYGYNNTDISYQTAVQLRADLLEMADLALALQKIGRKGEEKYGIKADTIEKARSFGAFFDLASKSRFITPAVLAPPQCEKVLRSVNEMSILSLKLKERKETLDKEFEADIYELNGGEIYRKLTKQFGGFFSRMFSREYRRIKTDIRLCKSNGKKPKYKDAVLAMDNLRVYQQKKTDFDILEASVQDSLGYGYQGVDTDFAQYIYELSEMGDIHASGISLSQLSSISKKCFAEERDSFTELGVQYKKAFAHKNGLETRFALYFQKSEYDYTAARLERLEKKCEECYQNTDKLDNWCEFISVIKNLEELEIKSYVDKSIRSRLEPRYIVSSFKKAFYMQWIDAVMHESPLLMALCRVPHDEAVRKFKEKDELNFEINKALIKARLSEKRPETDMITQGSEISVLLREGEKKRKQKSIRTLLSEVSELALTLKPCFLMSPLSVSTYLSADMTFDVVIFDEASQIFPQDAMGAIYRGKQLIVVGDSRQMPPSNFFGASIDEDYDGEAEDVNDFESILDICSTAFPQRRLKWHYRSRFEQLITFSNRNFYDGDLVTFPASRANRYGDGVDYVFTEGVFDRRTKTNRQEAERVVDLVFKHIKNHPERSLGVVAFSVAQQQLIDRLISKRRRQDPSREAFFRADAPEPFFVKNLETVQGDERDIIIFSIAYARDKDGRLLLNFGPLNREGGERRLNVAVTRAKLNIKVVTSLHSGDIDITGSKSVGVKLLRDYLDFAENGAPADTTELVNPFEREKSELLDEVCDFLCEKGYAVDTRVGCSSFKVDMAVKSPDTSDYVIAVECDGNAYCSSKTTRDRDRLRQSILEKMGWSYYRVWSTDWYRNKRIEKERLLLAVKKAVDGVKELKIYANNEISFSETVENTPIEFPEYELSDIAEVCKRNKGNAQDVAMEIIKKEAPISEDWLLKRIVFLFDGREKVTAAVRKEFDSIMKGWEEKGIVRRDGFIYLRDTEIPMLRLPRDADAPREIKYICPDELSQGIVKILEKNKNADRIGLYKLILSRLCLAPRLSEAAEEKFEKAISLISHKVEASEETLIYKA